MKKAICFLKEKKEIEGTLLMAKEYCQEKGYEFIGSITIDPYDFEKNNNKIFNELFEKKVDIILSNNDLLVYAQFFLGGSFFKKISKKGILWYDFTYDCLADDLAKNFISFIEESIEINHIPIIIISENMGNIENEDEFKKVQLYMSKVLNNDNYITLNYDKESNNLDLYIKHQILYYTPNYIIIYNEIQSEIVKSILDI